MKDYKVFIFDLDGTLTDSSEGIFRCFQYALDFYGMEIGEDRNRLIGPPLISSFKDFYGFDHETAEEACRKYRERYAVTGLFENRPYDGIKDVLKELKEAGKTLLVATSKPEEFTFRIMERFDLAKYFDFIAGAGFNIRDSKAEVIKYALESMNIKDVSDVLMIGDRSHDVIGAHKLGIDCLTILYGFGNREEFEAAGADYIEEKVEDILKYK